MTESLTNTINEVLKKIPGVMCTMTFKLNPGYINMDRLHKRIMEKLTEIDYQWNEEFGEHEEFSNAVQEFLESKMTGDQITKW